MSSTNRVTHLSLAQIITVALAAALLLGLAVNASAGTGLLDSVKGFSAWRPSKRPRAP